jgi:hypothetical protein
LKRAFTIFVLLLISSAFYGQRISKKEASRIVQSAITSLRNNDTASFVALWYIDDSPWPYHDRVYSKKNAVSEFGYLREFMDTALVSYMAVDHIDIDRENSNGLPLRSGQRIVRVWFRYGDYYYKGFGFHLEYINRQWMVRFTPDTSTLLTRS